MIQKEWRRVFGTRTMLFVILLFLLIEGVLLVYTEQKNRRYSAEAYCTVWEEVEALLKQENAETVLEQMNEHIQQLAFLEFFLEFGAEDLYMPGGIMGVETEEEFYEILEELYPGIDISMVLEKYRAGEMLRHTDRPSVEKKLYQEVATELQGAVSYPEYREGVVADAERMLRFSVFAKPGTFGYRNIEATLEKYKGLPEITIEPTPAKSVATLMQGSIPGILLLFFLLYLCIPLYLSEKEEGTIRLTRTCVKGRKALAGTKLTVFLLGALLMQGLLYGVRFLVLQVMYGFPDLSRSIQSVSGFGGCVIPATIGQYFMLLFLLRYGVLCLCAIGMALFCSLCSNAKKAYVGIVVLFAIQVLCYYVVPATASYGALHFVNLWGMLRFDSIGNYLNLNLFGTPVSCLAVTIVTLGLGMAFAFPIAVWAFCKKPGDKSRTKKKRQARIRPQTVSLFFHEGRKLFFDQKVLLVLIMMLAVQMARYHTTEKIYSVDDVYYQYYMEQLSGPLTPEKEIYMEEEALYFRTLHSGGDFDVSAQKKLNAEGGFQKAYDRYQYIKNTQNGEFFYDTGYRYLLAEGTYKTDMFLAVTAIVLLVITGAGIFGMDMETGMLSLLTTTRNGENGIRARLLWGSILTVAVWVTVYLPDFVNTLENYGTQGMMAPAQSIELLKEVKYLLVWQYFVCLYVSRLLGLLVVSGVLYLLSYFTRSTAATIFGTLAIFLIPSLLLLLREGMTDILSLFAPFSGNMLRRYPGAVSIFVIGLYVLFVIFGYWYMIKRRKILHFLFTNCRK